MTGEARGPCRGSGPLSSRPEWCVRCQNTSCTSMSCAVCSSCRAKTSKAAFSTASLAWNGKKQHQILLFLWTFVPHVSNFKFGNILLFYAVEYVLQFHSFYTHFQLIQPGKSGMLGNFGVYKYCLTQC